jgi:hypothetical protein
MVKTMEEKFDKKGMNAGGREIYDYWKLPGPWCSEYDKKQWIDPKTGLPCLVVRNDMGALCGYVGVPRGHPWYEKGYDSIDPYPSVHGGLTYASRCYGKICHEVEPGEPDDVWWLGFDCAHAGDVTPAIAMICGEDSAVGKAFGAISKAMSAWRRNGDEYRDVGYVEKEVADLALQAADAANPKQ